MKNYTITEEQIKELAKGNAKVKKWVPEVFETKLEVGKWYKRPKYGSSIFCVTKLTETRVFAYGLTFKNEWVSEKDFCDNAELDSFVLATEEEVFEALKNEAVKRGFKENVWIKYLGNTQNGNFYYNSEINYLYCGSYSCFQDGVWAEIIETLTKEEAEKKLNVKIIN